MATATFMDTGGDTDNQLQTGASGMWASLQNTARLGIVTDYVNPPHTRSFRIGPTSSQSSGALLSANPLNNSPVLANSGTRVSFYFYMDVATNVLCNLWQVDTIYANGVYIRLNASNQLELWNSTTAKIGSTGATTLTTGRWYRISLAYTQTSTTINEYRLFIDGVIEISVTNATMSNITGTTFRFGTNTLTTPLDWRISDIYVDRDSSLTDMGNVKVTHKRPVADGSLNEFTTQIGAGNSGYGTGHSDEVNEIPLSQTNGWSISTTTRKTEKFTLEALSVGAFDLTGATILDYMGWANTSVGSTANSPVHRIILNNATTAFTNATTAVCPKVFANSTTYPTALDAIGIDAQYTTTPQLTRLFECGVMVAYLPASVSVTHNVSAPLSATFSIPSSAVTADVTVTASVLSATFSIPASTVTATQSITVSPSALSATFSIPAPTITAIQNPTVTPSVLTATFSIPAPTVTAEQYVTVSPNVLSATFSIPAPTIVTSVSVTPSVLTATFSIPAPSVEAGGDTSHSASPLVLTFSIPAPTVTAERFVTVTASVLTATFSIPASTAIGGADITASPNVLAMTMSVQAPTVTGGATASPNVLAMTFSIPASTVTAIRNETVTPSVLTATFSIPSSTVTAEQNVVVSPDALSLTFSIPAPTITATRTVTVSASVLTATFSIPASVVTAEQSVTVSASVLAMTFSIPSVAVQLGISVTPSVLAMTFSIPSPTITTTRFVTVTPEPLFLTLTMPAVAITGDYWQPKFPVVNVQTFTDKVFGESNNWEDKEYNEGNNWSDKY